MTRDVDMHPNFDFTPAFDHVRSLAQKARFFASGDDGKKALIEALAVVTAWPTDHPMSRFDALSYLEQAVFGTHFGGTLRRFRLVTGVAYFGPAKPEYGTKACMQRAVTGVLLEPDMARHEEADLRTWVFGQPHATLQGWNSDTGEEDEKLRWKVIPNAHGLPYGLFVGPGTIRDASPGEQLAFLEAASPVHEPMSYASLWNIPDAVGRVAKLSAEAAPFWRWSEGKPCEIIL